MLRLLTYTYVTNSNLPTSQKQITNGSLIPSRSFSSFPLVHVSSSVLSEGSYRAVWSAGQFVDFNKKWGLWFTPSALSLSESDLNILHLAWSGSPSLSRTSKVLTQRGSVANVRRFAVSTHLKLRSAAKPKPSRSFLSPVWDYTAGSVRYPAVAMWSPHCVPRLPYYHMVGSLTQSKIARNLPFRFITEPARGETLFRYIKRWRRKRRYPAVRSSKSPIHHSNELRLRSHRYLIAKLTGSRFYRSLTASPSMFGEEDGSIPSHKRRRYRIRRRRRRSYALRREQTPYLFLTVATPPVSELRQSRRLFRLFLSFADSRGAGRPSYSHLGREALHPLRYVKYSWLSHRVASHVELAKQYPYLLTRTVLSFPNQHSVNTRLSTAHRTPGFLINSRARFPSTRLVGTLSVDLLSRLRTLSGFSSTSTGSSKPLLPTRTLARRRTGARWRKNGRRLYKSRKLKLALKDHTRLLVRTTRRLVLLQRLRKGSLARNAEKSSRSAHLPLLGSLGLFDATPAATSAEAALDITSAIVTNSICLEDAISHKVPFMESNSLSE